MSTAAAPPDKAYLAGTHRTRPPEVTWALVQPHLRRFGITRVADVTGLDWLGVPVAMAVRPLARTLSVSQGKGTTQLLARISAAMESIEVWHAEYAPPPVSYGGVPAAELDLPYQLTQLDLRPAALTTTRTPLNWTNGAGLLSGATIAVPLDLVTLVPQPSTWAPPGLWPSTNGLASGNAHLEAVLHALYELIERDSIASATEVMPVDLDSVDDELCVRLLKPLRRPELFLEVSALANRHDVPCYSARIWSEDFPVLALGSGAHSAPDVAFLRAVTEAAQSRLTAITGTRDDQPAVYGHVSRALGGRPQTSGPLINWRAPFRTSPAPSADIATEASAVAGRVRNLTGVEPIVVPLTTLDELAVVKVIAPGLRRSAADHDAAAKVVN